MYCFKISKVDSNICALYIDHQFYKYLKTTDWNKLRTHLISLEGYQERSSSFSSSEEGTWVYELDLNKEQFAHTKALLLYGEGKIPLVLSHPLNTSQEYKRPIYYSHRSLSAFSRYWERMDVAKVKGELYKLLSEDIIEIPYVDKPLDYEYRFGKIAFHPNHGTAHGLRSVSLFNWYLDLAKEYKAQEILMLEPEEIQCLELALFLFRSGRTNELGWAGDPTYSPRSAAIFTHIAIQLGFNNELVKQIADSFDYQKEINSSITTTITQDSLIKLKENKKSLYQSLFELCHMSDLIRCFTNYDYLKIKISQQLENLSINNLPQEIEQIVDISLNFAALCCKITGSPIHIIKLQQSSGGSLQGSALAAVNAATNVPEILNQLDKLRTTPLNENILPIRDNQSLFSRASLLHFWAKPTINDEEPEQKKFKKGFMD